MNNIFVDVTRLISSSTYVIINGLSDNGIQFLTVNNTVPASNTVPLKQRTREINKRIMKFQLQVVNETCESVYIDSKVR
jgi:hypothetical protein